MENTLQWLERSRLGDREAFARIVAQYQGMVSAVTLNITGDFAQSEDLAQETFLTAWKKLPELREPEKLASWIYGIAKRTALHWYEKQRRNPLQGAAELDDQTLTDRQAQAETDRRRQQEQSLELVWSTVKELPEIFREPLLLYYRYSKSVADIAASMELTEDAVNQRLSRGRKLLKAEVEKQVESVLSITRPDAAFTLAVISSIPATAAAVGLLAATPALAAESSVGSGGASLSATVGSGSIGGIICGLFGLLALPLIFLASGLFGVWNCIRNAPTIRTRRYMIRSCLIWYVITWLAFGFLIFITPGIENTLQKMPEYRMIYKGVCLLIFSSPVFFLGQVCYRWRLILAQDWNVSSQPDRPLEESFLSQRKINRLFWFAAGLPFLWPVLGVIVSGLPSVPSAVFDLIDVVFYVSLMIVAHCSLLGLISRGIHISGNEEDLHRTPPRNTAWLTAFRNELTTRGLGTRSAMIVDIVLMFLLASPFVLGGLIPQAWIPASKTVTVGLDGILFMLFIPELIAIYFITQFAGRPGRRLQGYSRLCVSMGVFVTATVLLIRFPVQSMRLSLLWNQPREYFYPYFEGLVSELPMLALVLGFYFGLALFAYAIRCWFPPQKQKPEGSEAS